MSKRINEAIEYAREYHKGDLRISGETYFAHTYRVYKRLVDAGIVDEDVLIVALLHNVYHLPNPNEEELKRKFGEKVVGMLKQYKDISSRQIKRSSDWQENNKFITQAFVSLAADLDILLIILADKADNIKTSHVFSKEERYRFAMRILQIYSPLARLLGLHKFVGEMEDEAFKIINPKEYIKIERSREKIKEEVLDFFEDADKAIRSFLTEKGTDAEIKTRFKSTYSIYLRSIKYPDQKVDFGDIYDLAGMRILVDTESDCYEVESMLCNLWARLDDTRNDYIQNPKPNGYKTLQSSYKVSDRFYCEIQIRTNQMDRNNEYGVSSHVFYKIGESLKKQLELDPDFLRRLNYWERKKLEEDRIFKQDLFDVVYTFTPKGDIIELPKGSTVLDFAFALHLDLGHSCIGADVNGKNARISQELQNGDVVKIRTDGNKAHANRDRIDYVKTKKAKNAIKHILKQ
jgi:GTP diphosphokinase / guanosine-3',5'-bis(diphosphate) 3'-diphosphatase